MWEKNINKKDGVVFFVLSFLCLPFLHGKKRGLREDKNDPFFLLFDFTTFVIIVIVVGNIQHALCY